MEQGHNRDGTGTGGDGDLNNLVVVVMVTYV